MTPDEKKKFGFIAIAIISGVSIVIDLFSQSNDSKIYDYLPYINGVVFTTAGLYLLLFSFGIYKPKYKTEDQKERVDNLLQKKGNTMKFSSLVLIIFGVYNLISHDPNLYRLKSRVEDDKWTDGDKQIFINDCIKKAGSTAKDHPEIILDYCTCLINATMKGMSKKQYIYDLSLPKHEQHEKFGSVFLGCKIIVNRKLDSVAKPVK